MIHLFPNMCCSFPPPLPLKRTGVGPGDTAVANEDSVSVLEKFDSYDVHCFSGKKTV